MAKSNANGSAPEAGNTIPTPPGGKPIAVKSGPVLAKRKSSNLRNAGLGTLDSSTKRTEVSGKLNKSLAATSTAPETNNEQREESSARPERESSSMPSYLEDGLANFGMDASDFATPEAAHKALRRLQSTNNQREQPRGEDRQQQREAPKKFDLLEGFNRDEFQAELGEKPTAAMLAMFERLHNHYNERVEQLAQDSQYLKHQAAQNYNATVDNTFESLNSEYGGMFGDGSIDELNPSSLEYENRMQVCEAAQNIVAARGGRMSPRAALKQAAAYVLGPKKSKAKPKAQDDEEETRPLIGRNRVNQFVGAGSGGGASDAGSGKAKTLNVIGKYMGLR